MHLRTFCSHFLSGSARADRHITLSLAVQAGYLPRVCEFVCQDIIRRPSLAYLLCEILAEEQPDEVEDKESDQKTENQCHYDQEKTANDTDYQ